MRVIVLGAGLAGTTVAYYLARAGCAVEVIDRGDGAASEASAGTAGLIHVGLTEPWNSPSTVAMLLGSLLGGDAGIRLHASQLPGLLRWGLGFLRYSQPSVHAANAVVNAKLALYSQRSLAALREELGLVYDQRPSGMLKVFQRHERLASAVRTAARLEAYGIPFERLSRDDVVAREPLLAPVSASLAGALHFPGDESGCPATFARALSDHAAAAGAGFRFRTSVNGLDCSGGRFRAVRAGTERIEGDACVIAAGADSPRLARDARIRVPVKPVKGYFTTYPIAAETPVPAVPIVDDDRRIAINRLGARLRISGSAEFAGLDRTVDHAAVAAMVARACSTVPALGACIAAGEGAARACLRPTSADGVPIIGATPVSGLFVNTGSGHLGWTLAAGAARLAADCVLGKETALPLAPFSVTRFSWRR
jgi:D-amino-acid dehydrogenase